MSVASTDQRPAPTASRYSVPINIAESVRVSCKKLQTP